MYLLLRNEYKTCTLKYTDFTTLSVYCVCVGRVHSDIYGLFSACFKKNQSDWIIISATCDYANILNVLTFLF